MLVTISDKELSRVNVIQSVLEKRMLRHDAARQQNLTERQTQRLMNRFRGSGGGACQSSPWATRKSSAPGITETVYSFIAARSLQALRPDACC